ncbi:MAG: hypothetical protein ACK5KO_03595 [Arachnia sp.]
MVWVAAFVGIGLAGLVMVIAYAVWLAHKLSDLFSELEMLGTRAQEAADLLNRLQLPQRGND